MHASEVARAKRRDYDVTSIATTSRIVRIGSSRSIRAPKAPLEQAQLPDEVESQAEPGRLIVRAHRRTRAGWAEAAVVMHARGDEGLLGAPVGSHFDAEAWEWR